jgi:hypothetical protein
VDKGLDGQMCMGVAGRWVWVWVWMGRCVWVGAGAFGIIFG